MKYGMEEGKTDEPAPHSRVAGVAIDRKYLAHAADHDYPAVFVENIPYAKYWRLDLIEAKRPFLLDVLDLRPAEDLPAGQNPLIKAGLLRTPSWTIGELAGTTGGREFQIYNLLAKALDINSRQILTGYIDTSAKATPRILCIHAHGGGKPWIWGDKFGDEIAPDKFLRGLPGIISKLKGGQTDLSEIYDAIVVTACDTSDHTGLDPDIARQLGVPIFSVEGLSDVPNIEKGNSVTRIITPA